MSQRTKPIKQHPGQDATDWLQSQVTPEELQARVAELRNHAPEPVGDTWDDDYDNTAAPAADAPTDKQIGFFRSLNDRKGKLDFDGAKALMESKGQWTRKGVSTMIDALKSAPDAPGKAPVKTNRYPGRCNSCGSQVAEGEGRIERNSAGKWITFHLDGECPNVAMDPEAIESNLEGMHRLDGEIYKVQKAVHGSGNLYAKKLVTDSEWTFQRGTTKKAGSFEYAPGMINKLSVDTRMSLDEAKEFGRLYGFCCVCAATLTDERSIEAGIGPVCAGRF